MKIYTQPTKEMLANILVRPVVNQATLRQKVSGILNDVRSNGDAAIRKYGLQFDGVEIDELLVTDAEFEWAENTLHPDLKSAIQTAKRSIEVFHAAQISKPEVVETMPGVRCWRKSVGIERVGLYIPGGTAPLFSTVLMLGVPAGLAGCRYRILPCKYSGAGPPNMPCFLSRRIRGRNHTRKA